MRDIAAQLVAWLNAPANAVGRRLLAPIALAPGWLSITVVAAVLGVACLAVFKYTSCQRAMRRVRNDIQAHLLVLKLFPDSLWVTLRAEGRVLRGAGSLMLLSVAPMLAMVVPVSLLLAQLGLWYQARPLRIGEQAVVAVAFRGDVVPPDAWLEASEAVETVMGPVQVASRQETCWQLRARTAGYHRLRFHFAGQVVEKELAIGDGLMRTSVQRPEWDWADMLWQPAEAPFPPDSPIRWIRIDYPRRAAWASGSDWWLVYLFAASMFFGFCFRPWLKVAM